jgi:hypothetical protein
MKKLLLITACLMLLCEVKCYARIGETLEQCEKRYGKRITKKEELQNYSLWMVGIALSRNTRPELFGKWVSGNIGKNGEVKIDGDMYSFFRLDDYVICVKFDNEKVDSIRFMKSYKGDDEPRKIKLSKEEKEAFISSNSSGEKCVNFMFSVFADVLVIHTEEYNNKIEIIKELSRKEEDNRKKDVLKKF